MREPEIIDVRPLFAGERAALIELLASLPDDDWLRPTACPGWSVQDVAAHLLGCDLGRLSAGRDGHRNPNFQLGDQADPFAALVTAIDRQNAEWVTTLRRLSPRVLTGLLRWSGEEIAAYFATLDPLAKGPVVDWVGPGRAPVWVDLAREFTERWHHQQHIRDAVGAPGLTEPEWLHPVLATFALALPRSLRGTGRPAGTRVRLIISGDAGGTWELVTNPTGWAAVRPGPGVPAARIEIDADTAWRLFTNGLSPADALARATVEGDQELIAALLGTTSILSLRPE